MRSVDVFDVRFSGFNGEQIAAWLTVPKGAPPRTTVVQYHGYSGSRGFPFDNLMWSAAGYAHLSMDSRGQGWALDDVGVTPDIAAVTPRPARAHDARHRVAGQLLLPAAVHRRGPCRRLRPRATSRCDTRIVVAGGSQGGGITIAVAGLVDGLAGALPDVPFLCDYRRAVAITDAYPYREISDYCQAYRDQVDTVFGTLAYFDGTAFAARATRPDVVLRGLDGPGLPAVNGFRRVQRLGRPQGHRGVRVQRA